MTQTQLDKAKEIQRKLDYLNQQLSYWELLTDIEMPEDGLYSNVDNPEYDMEDARDPLPIIIKIRADKKNRHSDYLFYAVDPNFVDIENLRDKAIDLIKSEINTLENDFKEL